MAVVEYYLDEHIAEAVATGLRNRGIDVLTLSEAEMLGASDEDHLAYAYEEGRVLVTYDDDFLRLADQTERHAGIAFAPQGKAIGEMGRVLTLIVEEMEAEEIQAFRDPEDDKFLELAISENATCSVSGDLDLFEVDPFWESPITNPVDFLEWSRQNG